jgi:hypothetical protein
MVDFPAIFMLKMIYSIILESFCIEAGGGFIEAEDFGLHRRQARAGPGGWR